MQAGIVVKVAWPRPIQYVYTPYGTGTFSRQYRLKRTGAFFVDVLGPRAGDS